MEHRLLPPRVRSAPDAEVARAVHIVVELREPGFLPPPFFLPWNLIILNHWFN